MEPDTNISQPPAINEYFVQLSARQSPREVDNQPVGAGHSLGLEGDGLARGNLDFEVVVPASDSNVANGRGWPTTWHRNGVQLQATAQQDCVDDCRFQSRENPKLILQTLRSAS
jgi:hypothetical protein